MAQNHPMMQQLQQLLMGAMPPQTTPPSGQVLRDHAIALPAGQTLGFGKTPPPLGQMPGGIPMAQPGVPSTNTDPASSPHPNGLTLGQSMAGLLGGGLAGASPTPDRPKTPGGFAGTLPAELSGAAPAPFSDETPGGLMHPVSPQAPTPGNFNYMDVLKNSRAALPQQADWWNRAG